MIHYSILLAAIATQASSPASWLVQFNGDQIFCPAVSENQIWLCQRKSVAYQDLLSGNVIMFFVLRLGTVSKSISYGIRIYTNVIRMNNKYDESKKIIYEW